MRILIVEDDPQYRKFIAQMYQTILANENLDIQYSSDTPMTRALLESGKKFDFISFDIVLDKNATSIQGANARDLIRLASKDENNSCLGLITITGILHDSTAEATFNNQDEYIEIAQSLNNYVTKYFHPTRYLDYRKLPTLSPQQNIQKIQNQLTREMILNICRSQYEIEIIDRKNKICQIKNLDTEKQSQFDENEGKILCSMIEKNLLTHQDICKILGKKLDEQTITDKKTINKYANEAIKSLKRKLKSNTNFNINWKNIFYNKKKQGWCLLSDLRIGSKLRKKEESQAQKKENS